MALEYEALNDDQRALVKEAGVSAADFNALAPLDQEGLLADSSASDATTAEELQGGAGAAPAPSPAPSPAPAPAGEKPEGTEGDGDEGNEDDPEGLESPEAVAETSKWKAAAPAPTAAPAATPAPAPAATAPAAPAAPAEAPAPAARTWTADPNSPLGINLPDAPPAPPVLVTQADIGRRDTLKAERDTLFDQFAEGSLTKEDYQAKIKPLDTELEDLNSNIAAQKGLDAQHRQAVVSNWQGLVAHSFEVAKDIGLDYATDTKLQEQLDEAVIRFGKAASLMHPKKPMGWQDAWALAEAHKEIAAAHGKVYDPSKKGAAASPSPAPAPAGAPKPRAAPDLSALPPTTRAAPPAGDPGISAGEFAHLEGLNPIELEKAVAKMPADQQQRYLGA